MNIISSLLFCLCTGIDASVLRDVAASHNYDKLLNMPEVMRFIDRDETLSQVFRNPMDFTGGNFKNTMDTTTTTTTTTTTQQGSAAATEAGGQRRTASTKKRKQQQKKKEKVNA